MQAPRRSGTIADVVPAKKPPRRAVKGRARACHGGNLADAQRIAELMTHLYNLPKPTLAVVQGAVFGGGVGLVSCCDMAIGSDDATFCLSEVRIGLIPATIAPFVVKAIGQRAARRYSLTAERFDGRRGLPRRTARPVRGRRGSPRRRRRCAGPGSVAAVADRDRRRSFPVRSWQLLAMGWARFSGTPWPDRCRSARRRAARCR